MKKYLISAFALLILASLGVYAYYQSGIYGTWQNLNPQAGNIFDGSITIQKIKSTPDSQNKYFTVISDEQNHALSCSESIESKGTYACLPFLKSPNPITPESTIQDITIEAAMLPLLLQIKNSNYIFYHTLDMRMLYINKDCSGFDNDKCNYIQFPRYERW